MLDALRDLDFSPAHSHMVALLSVLCFALCSAGRKRAGSNIHSRFSAQG